MIIKDRNDNI